MYYLKVVTEEKFNTYKSLSSRYKDLVLRMKTNNSCITDLFVYEGKYLIKHYKLTKKGTVYYGL